MPANLVAEVKVALEAHGASPGSLRLWEEIHETYIHGGENALWEMLEKKVKLIRKSANAQASGMKAAAGSVEKKSRSKKRK